MRENTVYTRIMNNFFGQIFHLKNKGLFIKPDFFELVEAYQHSLHAIYKKNTFLYKRISGCSLHEVVHYSNRDAIRQS